MANLRTGWTLCLVAAISFTGPALAEQTTSPRTAKPGAAAGSTQKKPPSGARPTLTSGECEAVGGKVYTDFTGNECGVGKKMCSTADKNGVVRSTCIDEVVH